jgi:hypothetical protein
MHSYPYSNLVYFSCNQRRIIESKSILGGIHCHQIPTISTLRTINMIPCSFLLFITFSTTQEKPSTTTTSLIKLVSLSHLCDLHEFGFPIQSYPYFNLVYFSCNQRRIIGSKSILGGICCHQIRTISTLTTINVIPCSFLLFIIFSTSQENPSTTTTSLIKLVSLSHLCDLHKFGFPRAHSTSNMFSTTVL